VQWHEVEKLLAEGWRLVDVRTEGEYTRGAIPGSQLITLDELRDHLEDLLDQKVIVSCRVGQRGHTAASILVQHGIEVANLDGGYLTWQMGMAATTQPELVGAP
jgi:rhodanese-related sulfurtransferase